MTVSYRTVLGDHDADILQDDLDELARWEETWQMSFHPKKCQVLRVTWSRHPLIHDYSLRGTTLETADQAKYLGITITPDMKWNTHISNTCRKANSKLAFLRWNMRVGSTRLKEQLNKSVVRSNMEYAAAVWDPHEKKHIEALEKIQRRAARWVLNRHHNMSSMTSMLQELCWPLLEQRRACIRLALFYKIHNSLVGIPLPPQLTTSHIQYTRNTDNTTYTAWQTRTNYFRYSFFPITVTQWNALPVNTRHSLTPCAFKTQVAALEHVRPF